MVSGPDSVTLGRGQSWRGMWVTKVGWMRPGSMSLPKTSLVTSWSSQSARGSCSPLALHQAIFSSLDRENHAGSPVRSTRMSL